MLLITPGDPAGIGPEVTAKALAMRDPSAQRVCVIGAEQPMVDAAKRAGLRLHPVDHVSAPVPDRGVGLLDPGSVDEPVEVAAIRMAVHACLSGHAAGMVTGPIHKARLSAQGFRFPGHTDFLGHLCGVDEPVMAFTGGQLRVALATVHLPLREVADAITRERVYHTIYEANAALHTQLGIAAPSLLVCGLNPHAGDEGLLGREEIEQIAPAVARARDAGILVEGPISAEAAFRRAMGGDGDMVVAMYHDQGLAPLKAVDFGKSVNWTLGLPIVRTSVDHGTADDLAGRWLADPTSMLAALSLADELTLRRRSPRA